MPLLLVFIHPQLLSQSRIGKSRGAFSSNWLNEFPSDYIHGPLLEGISKLELEQSKVCYHSDPPDDIEE